MIVKASAFALCAVITSILLKELGWRGAPLVGVVASLGALGFILPYFSTLGSFYSNIAEGFQLSELTESVIKVIGVGYLGGISADVCRELGEGAVASAVGAVAKVEILVLTAPYFIKVVEMGVSLLE